MVSAFMHPMEFVLNVARTRADRRAMTRNPAEEPAEAERRSVPVSSVSPGGASSGRRPRRGRAGGGGLRAKVAVLAMQKDYWWQRSVEHASALRAAEAEVARLREALAPDLVLTK